MGDDVEDVKFTDTEKDASTLLASPDGKLEWHANGKLESGDVQALILKDQAIKVPGSSRLVARLVDPPPGPNREAMLRSLARLAKSVNVNLKGFSEYEDDDLPTTKAGRKATATMSTAEGDALP